MKKKMHNHLKERIAGFKNPYLLFLCMLCLGAIQAQELTISGTVTTEDGVPLPGATVLEKNTTNGIASDFDGNYAITVSDTDAILVFSSLGYRTEERTVGQANNLDVTLIEDSQALDEVVVVGYGTQTKKDITGAITNVSTEDLADLRVTGADQLLQGQAAGVQISQSNAAPGGAVKVNIRGSVSLTSGSQPLYVIDGFPLTNVNNQVSNPLTNLNPNDISSIQVLKDASASAIYGSRASNGVVLITTKRGQAGKTEFNVDIYSGMQSVLRKIDMLNSRQFAELFTESRNNPYIDNFGDQGAQITDTNEEREALGAGSSLYQLEPNLANFTQFGEGTDWQDEIFRVAPINNVQVSARGGTEKVKYYMSGSYFDQDGIVLSSGLKRYSFNTNLEAQVTDRLKMGFNLNASLTNTELVNAEGSWHSGGVVSSALVMPPTIPVRDENGDYNEMFDVYPNSGMISVSNPVQTALETERGSKQFRTIGTVFGEYEVVDDLRFKALFGADYYDYQEDKFSPSTVNTNTRGGNTAYRIKNNFLNYLTEFTLNYSKSFGDHDLGALAGYTIQKESYEGTRVQASDFPNDYVKDVTGGIISGYGSNPAEWSLLSYIGRINYDYKDKYLLTVNFRRDGSSRFGSNMKWGDFPSVSLGWRISEEPFLQDSQTWNEFKIRGSYGLTGNNAIGNYAAIGLLRPSNYVVDGNVALGLEKGSVQNDDLSWETTKQLNVGVDLGFFNNRLFVIADYYKKNTEDLLLRVPVSSITGVSSIVTNIGEVENKGWELGINTKNLVGEFTWDTSLNVSANRNKVTKLGLTDEPIFFGNIAGRSHVAQIGSPIGSYYGFVWDGLYLTQMEIDNGPDNQIGGFAPHLGDVRFKDLNNDGVINTEDQTVLGDWEPDFVYGITNNFSYKNIDLSIFLQGSQGNEVYNIQRRNHSVRTLYGNETTETLIRWQSPDNIGNGRLPKVNRVTPLNSTTRSSDYYVADASYLSIRNITLGYTIPRDITDKLSLSRLRTYISIQNAFLFTDYQNYNPEVNASNSTGTYNTGINPLVPGLDYGSYPLARTFTIGLNLSF